LNVAKVAPSGTVTLEGTVTTFGLELLSNTLAPPDPAGSVRMTVAIVELPLNIQAELTVKLLRAGGATGATVTVNVILTPEQEAVSVTEVEALIVPAVTVNVAVVEPAATVTLAGTPAAAVLELESDTATPPVPAAEVRVTVPVRD